MTEGEELIKEFFEEKAIRYKSEYLIPKLRNDIKEYRVADFYLPEYKVCVEFLGRWNNEEHKQMYKKKMEIYKENSIPCVYLYPDNLGILNFIFPRRLRKVLKDYNLKWSLFRFNLDTIIELYSLQIILCIFLIIYVKGIGLKIGLLCLFLIWFYFDPMKKTFLK